MARSEINPVDHALDADAYDGLEVLEDGAALPLPCVSATMVDKTVPFLADFQVWRKSRRCCDRSPRFRCATHSAMMPAPAPHAQQSPESRAQRVREREIHGTNTCMHATHIT